MGNGFIEYKVKKSTRKKYEREQNLNSRLIQQRFLFVSTNDELQYSIKIETCDIWFQLLSGKQVPARQYMPYTQSSSVWHPAE